ncbi:hypothetical protein N2152v2_008473 [Parachlorella kessleri]
MDWCVLLDDLTDGASCPADAQPPPAAAWPLAAAAASEPKEPSLWDQWARVKGFLTSWRSRKGAGAGGASPLPVDKLKCHMPPGGFDPAKYKPVVLVSCGSFNPPTFMHLRMMELAQQALTLGGWDVLGGYLSPVNDAYWKRTLAPGKHRLHMCQLATADSDSLMVDPWEVEQRQYTRTLHVLKHVESELRRVFNGGDSNGAQPVAEVFQAAGEPAPVACPTSPPPRVMLVCGADVVLSMADPAVWRQDLLEELLTRHGVVCITRDGSDVAALLDRPGSLLHTHRANVAIVKELVPNEISSSRVRHELEQGRSVKYLLPQPVISYIYQHGLYNTSSNKPPLLRAGRREPVYVFDPHLSLFVSAEDLVSPHPL